MTNTQIQDRYARALAAWVAFGALSGILSLVKEPWDKDFDHRLLWLSLVIWVLRLVAMIIALALTAQVWLTPDVVDVPDVEPADDHEKTLTELKDAAAAAVRAADKAIAAHNPQHTHDIARHTDPK